MRKIERTVAAMNKKLKKLTKKKRKSKRSRSQSDNEEAGTSNLNAENTAPRCKSRRIDTSTATAAFTPRLEDDDSETPLRRAKPEHLRSARNSHLRSVENIDGAESDPNNGDDVISLFDGDNYGRWSPHMTPDYEQDETVFQTDDVDQTPVAAAAAAAVAGDDEVDEIEGFITGLEFVTSTEGSAPDINSAWAEKLKGIWVEDNNLHSMKPLYEKYKIPGNCDNVCAPTMNAEMKRLLHSSWDKKTDITYNGMQKTLTKVFAATVQLNTLNMSKNHTAETKQKGMQITADIVTMLGHVSYELSNQRKFLLGKFIQPQYRQLCAKDTVKPTKFLFGENLSQLIKDVQVKSKIGYRDNNTRGRGRGSGRGTQPFLGYGRGRSHNRAPQGRGYQRGGYQNQYLNQGQNSNHNKKRN